ncbi:hypothetical protein Tco_0127390 [Tanacetum coccineum]
MMEADRLLCERLQAREREELTIEEKSKLFVEFMNKRKKHFAELRAKEKRNKPPTKAQKRNQMSTYLKNMGTCKHSQLKSKTYKEIERLFEIKMKRVNTFIPMDQEVESSKKDEAENKSKRAREELEFDVSKKQKTDEQVTNSLTYGGLLRWRVAQEASCFILSSELLTSDFLTSGLNRLSAV